ncbi:TrmH family RNA methyltransferase [Prosthecomicrobium hirschii]|uniref:TrmH family RNA methyltransferase n=1 Tax=Prosthecodimorpha hirschii TaxID=665126 RepID=UPI00221F4668|nr:RNA methyltransferase [Prosthecomicrobium hirschii]MCW1841151.1 RNA methyltransferase [Prosthecomicrobium hirschii]
MRRPNPPRPPAPQRAGQIKEVSSLANPVVKEMRALQLKKERQRTGLFLAEGLKLIADAIDQDWPIRVLAYAAKVKDQPMVRRIARAAVDRGALVLVVSEDVLEKISRRDNPQMVVAVFEQRLIGLDDIDLDRSSVWVALETVKDPGNLGTIIRTADSVGASGVILIGDTTDPFALEAVRATMGSIFNIGLAAATAEEFVAWKRRTGVPVVGTHLAGAVDYRSLRYAEPGILLMGNEQSGLPDDLVAACDHTVKIPMAGRADSLNLAVATAVMLYEMRRPRLKL